MTRLTYILLLLPLLSFGQIDNDVLPLLNEWKNEARSNGEWEAPGKVAKHLGGVVFISEQEMISLAKTKEEKRNKKLNIVPAGLISLEVETGLFGHVFIYPVIYIQEEYRNKPYELKFIIWHELWHLLGVEIKDHTANGITGISINDNWDEKAYWESVKKLPPDAYYKKNDNTYY